MTYAFDTPDQFVICQSGDTDAIAELRRQAAEEFEQRQDNHRLSTRLMIRRGGFWGLYDEE